MLKANYLLNSFIFLVGVLIFSLLSQKELNHGIYVSENNLIIGLVKEKYTKNDHAYFHEIWSDIVNTKASSYDWLKEKMTEIGLEVYSQNFSIKHPLISPVPIEGTNLFGILRSPSGQNTESIILLAPLRDQEQALKGSYSVLLACANHLKSQVYWAKDIIFLFVDMDYLGLQAWLDAYHGTFSSEYITWNELDGRSGSIQAAINVEFVKSRVFNMEIDLAGINGLMPNLDLFSTLLQMAFKHYVIASLNDQVGDSGRMRTGMTNGYMAGSVTDMVGFYKAIYKQATGSSSSLHGLFLGYQIPAIGIHEAKANPSFEATSGAPLTNLVKVLEGSLRSLNNLQERLHQSFYFYLLPNTSRYVSIGVYFPPFLLVIMSIASELVAIILMSETREKLFHMNWIPVISVFALSAVLATFAWKCIPDLALYWFQSRGTFPSDAMTVAVLVGVGVPTGLAFFGALFARFVLGLRLDGQLVMPLLAAIWALFLACLACSNISMAYLAAVVFCPSIIVLTAKSRLIRALFSLAALVLTSPLVVTWAACVVRTYMSDLQHKPVISSEGSILKWPVLASQLQSSVWQVSAADYGSSMMQVLLEHQMLQSLTWTIFFGPMFALWLTNLTIWLLSSFTSLPAAPSTSSKLKNE